MISPALSVNSPLPAAIRCSSPIERMERERLKARKEVKQEDDDE